MLPIAIRVYNKSVPNPDFKNINEDENNDKTEGKNSIRPEGCDD